MMALVYSAVDALPPRSPVMVLPSAIVWNGTSQRRTTEQTQRANRKCSLLDLVGVVLEIHVSGSRHSSAVVQIHVVAPTNLSIINDESRSAVGLAKPFPATVWHMNSR